MGLVFEIGRTNQSRTVTSCTWCSVSAKVSPLNRHLHAQADMIRALFRSVGGTHLFHDPLLIQRCGQVVAYQLTTLCT